MLVKFEVSSPTVKLIYFDHAIRSRMSGSSSKSASAAAGTVTKEAFNNCAKSLKSCLPFFFGCLILSLSSSAGTSGNSSVALGPTLSSSLSSSSCSSSSSSRSSSSSSMSLPETDGIIRMFSVGSV